MVAAARNLAMKHERNGSVANIPPALAPFDRAMRGLVKVPKSEVDAEEKKWKAARKARRKRRQKS
jgi:hypothetical protein